MWYFVWILGIGLACTFSTLNALWFEFNLMDHLLHNYDKKNQAQKINKKYGDE